MGFKIKQEKPEVDSVQGSQFLETEPVRPLVIRLALPAVAAQVINMLYNIVDRIYIGHIPGVGALALTGVGVCLPVILVVSAFACLVAMGGAPQASIAMGKGQHDQAEKIMGHCLVLLILIAVALTAVLLIFGQGLLLNFGASANTIDYAIAYLNVYAIGTIFVQLTLGMNAFITAQGFAKTGMITVAIGAVCNIVLDPIFIFGFGMGVRGAALATIISQAVSCVWVLRFLRSPQSTLRIKKKAMGLSREVLLPCVALGVAPFIMQSSESVISVCFNASLLRYGGDIAVGAMTILTSVMQFAMLPLQGLGQGAQPVVSYNFGAKNKDRVIAAFVVLLKTSLAYSLVLWVLVMLFPGSFAAIFTTDTALQSFTAWALRIYAAGMGIFGIQIACQMTFIALGNAKASVLVAVMRKFVLLIPLIYFLPALMANQTLAVYLAEPAADILAVTFTAILFVFQFKKAMRQLD
ncbi:MAG: MATE family efflux transporter [Eubacteriaceae bacterium]|nr:MATE family efflux transporter [Eubacteriaceae bacterium]MDD4507343.1 MATE family efflux transporter [Eubacteriaceae bacterium]